MKILLDHSAPMGLARYLSLYEVKHTSELGWEAVSNGKLLKLAEDNDYRLMITADKIFRGKILWRVALWAF